MAKYTHQRLGTARVLRLVRARGVSIAKPADQSRTEEARRDGQYHDDGDAHRGHRETGERLRFVQGARGAQSGHRGLPGPHLAGAPMTGISMTCRSFLRSI